MSQTERKERYQRLVARIRQRPNYKDDSKATRVVSRALHILAQYQYGKHDPFDHFGAY